MNSEDLIESAAEAIAEFSRLNDSLCTLYIENGAVVAAKLKDLPPNHPACLTITKYRQQTGFSSAEWHTIGNALFNLYTKELACQAHPKP